MISNKNIKIYYLTQFLEGAVFTLPIIIVFLQARMTLVHRLSSLSKASISKLEKLC